VADKRMIHAYLRRNWACSLSGSESLRKLAHFWPCRLRALAGQLSVSA